MKNLEVLRWGMKHIASNHNVNFGDEIDEGGSICVWSTSGCNVPTLGDVKMLCEDLSIPSGNIDVSAFGVDVFVTKDWYDKHGCKDYNGHGLWKRESAIL